MFDQQNTAHKKNREMRRTHPLSPLHTVEWEEIGDEVYSKICGNVNMTIAEVEHVEEEVTAEDPDHEHHMEVTLTTFDVNDPSVGCMFEFVLEAHEEEAEEKTALADAWLYSILSVIVVSLCSVAGMQALLIKLFFFFLFFPQRCIVTFVCFKRTHPLPGILMLVLGCSDVTKYLTPMLSLSVGTLLGSTAFALLPETAETIGLDAEAGAVLLAGIMFGLLSEKFLHMHQHTGMHDQKSGDPKVEQAPDCARCEEECPHDGEVEMQETVCVTFHNKEGPKPVKSQPSTSGEGDSGRRNSNSTDSTPPELVKQQQHHPRRHLALVNLLGDAIHNFIDGALIGATYLVSTRTGLTLSLAIVLHELPQEFGDFGVLLHAGFSVQKALLANFAVACFAVLGCILALLIGEEFEEGTLYLLPFASGLFLYLALAGIIPELMASTKSAGNRQQRFQKGVSAICWILVGIGIMALLLLMPEAHNHGGAGHDDHGHGDAHAGDAHAGH